jgi:hypothetical protein
MQAPDAATHSRTERRRVAAVTGDQGVQCDLRFHNDEIDFASFCPIKSFFLGEVRRKPGE